MDRGAWQTTEYGVARVGHDLATKQQKQQKLYRPGESGITCSKYLNIETTSQKHSIQQNYPLNMKER